VPAEIAEQLVPEKVGRLRAEMRLIVEGTGVWTKNK
jgi:hypothetical protein